MIYSSRASLHKLSWKRGRILSWSSKCHLKAGSTDTVRQKYRLLYVYRNSGRMLIPFLGLQLIDSLIKSVLHDYLPIFHASVPTDL